MMSKKKSKSKSKKKMAKEAADAHAEFGASLARQLGHEPLNIKYDDGLSAEMKEILFADGKQPVQTEAEEPGPGEVGYAPTQKVGNDGFPTYEEWLKKHFNK
jgi:hypothetical protein